jgi:hypothetical protein
MSALGIWNNRYEGGPCYAACMETFTLYFYIHIAITPPSPSAGKDATMEQAGSTPIREEQKPSVCANDSPLSPCQSNRVSLSQSLTCGCTPRCFPQFPKISTGLASPASAGRDIDLSLQSSMKPVSLIYIH